MNKQILSVIFGSAILGLARERQRNSGSPNKTDRKKKFIVKSAKEGLKVIQHKDITDNWKKSLKVKPKSRVAVLLPCAATKPFAESKLTSTLYSDSGGNLL